MTQYNPDYYAVKANELGWGEDSAVLDPERAAYLKELSVGSVLDVGCATGIYVDMIINEGHEGSGIDFVKEFVEYAQKNRQGEYKVGSIYEIPYPNKSFDTVWALDILEHVDDKKALEELKRVASKRIIIVVPAVANPELQASGIVFRDYIDQSHLRYYSKEMIEKFCSELELKPQEMRGWPNLILEV